MAEHQEVFGEHKIFLFRRLGSNVPDVRRSNPAGKSEPSRDAGAGPADLSLEVETQPEVPDATDSVEPEMP